MTNRERARDLLRAWKGDNYAFGPGALDHIGPYVAGAGAPALVFANDGAWLRPTVGRVMRDLAAARVRLAGEVPCLAARPNTPREDVYRMADAIRRFTPGCIVVVGAGSSIDAAKAANVLATLGDVADDVEAYFGVGKVTDALARSGRTLRPLVAVQTAAGSAAHLTRYANVTDTAAGQKKLIVDDAIVPAKAVFDYSSTLSASPELTVDGALDSLAHSLEVFYGIGDDGEQLAREIALLTLELVLQATPAAIADQADLNARTDLGLAADLGGYAIMVGGTNGGHLTSFSLVDVTSHGRACGVMNPYYTVFFAPAIEDRVRAIGRVYRQAGFVDTDLDTLSGRCLGEAVAAGMIAFARSIGTPATLGELPAFTDAHIQRALAAAKNPQLDMKLKNMPVPLNASLVDEYMGPVLNAARTGDISLIRNV